MGFPTAKVHRRSRRQLGRGQHVALPMVTVVPTTSGSIAVLTFSVPVVINGSLDILLTGLAFISQTQISSTVWHVLYSGAVTGVAYTGIPVGSPAISTMQGGSFAGLPAGVMP